MSTKDKILKTAFELFVEKGYENTPITDILGACDISKGALYHHFVSKEKIMDEIIDNFINNDYKEISKFIEDRNISEMQKLNIIFDNAINNNKQFNLGSKESIFYHRSMEKSKLKTIQILESIIQNGVDNNEIKVENSHVIATYIYASMSCLLENTNEDKMKNEFRHEFYKMCSNILGYEFKKN